MPRGGFRPGAGRPPRARNPQAIAGAQTQVHVALTGIEYLQQLINDQTADPIRRDRAAQVLAAIESRRGTQPGKKLMAEHEAEWAGFGTSWWRLLHPEGHTPKSPMPESVREEMRRQQQAKASPSDDERAQARRWSELLDKRHAPTPPPAASDDDWGSDLDYNPEPMTPDPDKTR